MLQPHGSDRRWTRSGGRAADGSGVIVIGRRRCPRDTPTRPFARIRRSTVHRATSHTVTDAGDARPCGRRPGRGPCSLSFEHRGDQLGQFRVPQLSEPCGPVAGGGVVRRRGDHANRAGWSTRQIGSTPNRRPSWASMNAVTTVVAGRAPARRKEAANKISLARFNSRTSASRSLILAESLPRRSWALSRVNVGLLDPAHAGVRFHPDPLPDPLHRGVHGQLRFLPAGFIPPDASPAPATPADTSSVPA